REAGRAARAVAALVDVGAGGGGDSIANGPVRIVRCVGQVMLIGLQELELAEKKSAVKAAGFTLLFGYMFVSFAARAEMGYT
ncbi:hypothetical protein RA273_28865, partial [Pseudomonas syringae pv. tagetis]